MDGRNVVYVFLLISIPVTIVDAFMLGDYFVFNANGLDRKLLNWDALKKLGDKDALSEWDRDMERQLHAKYKELFYAAYADRSKPLEQARQVVMRHIQVNRPKVSDEVLKEIKSLKKTEIKGTANWQLIMSTAKMGKPKK